MTEFLLGLALGAGCALILWVGLFEAGRLRASQLDVTDKVLRRDDELRRVVRGPFEG